MEKRAEGSKKKKGLKKIFKEKAHKANKADSQGYLAFLPQME